MEQVALGVYRSHAPSTTLPPYEGTECYWICDGGRTVLVDVADGSSAAREVLERDWAALGRPVVQAVVATHHHRDHSGGGPWARKLWQAPLYLHSRDIELLGQRDGFEMARLWQPYEEPVLMVGSTAVHLIEAPGHTPGQWNLWVPKAGALLAGDNVLGSTSSVIGPPEGDMGAYLETLAALRRVEPRVILPGHGPVVSEPDTYLAGYIAHREERNRQILGLLHDGPRTARSLAESLYRDTLPPEKMPLGEWMVQGHLDWFRRQGLVDEENGRYRKVDGHDISR